MLSFWPAAALDTLTSEQHHHPSCSQVVVLPQVARLGSLCHPVHMGSGASRLACVLSPHLFIPHHTAWRVGYDSRKPRYLVGDLRCAQAGL